MSYTIPQASLDLYDYILNEKTLMDKDFQQYFLILLSMVYI